MNNIQGTISMIVLIMIAVFMAFIVEILAMGFQAIVDQIAFIR